MKLVMILVENIDQVGDLQVVLEEAEQDGQIDFPFGMKTIDVNDDSPWKITVDNWEVS